MNLPNIKSAAKRARQNIVREQRNRRTKSNIKTSIRRFEETVQSGDLEESRNRLITAVRHIDKAAAKGVVHKNNASRKKSRLTKMLNKIEAV